MQLDFFFPYQNYGWDTGIECRQTDRDVNGVRDSMEHKIFDERGNDISQL